MKQNLIKGIVATILAIVTVVITLGCVSYKKVDDTINLMQTIDKEEVKAMTNNNISEDTISTLKENWTIAIFGIDARDTDDLTGANSDVIILASINNKTGNINLTSVYRDTCLKTGNNRYRKVNEAYAIGGPKKAVEVLNENLDLQIDDYIAVNWKSVATAINILGGVDIEITKDELKYINGYITETVNSTGIGSVQIKDPGLHHLDGIQAVAYSRIRYTSGNDYKRTERQRTILASVLEKAKQADWATINNVIVTVFPMTSSSIDTNSVIEAGLNISKYKLNKTGGFPFAVIEKRVNKQDFVFPDSLESNVKQLHEFLYGTTIYEPSDTVKAISKKIDNKRLSENTSSHSEKRETAPVEISPTIETESEIEQKVIEPESADSTEVLNLEVETDQENIIESELSQEERNDENYGPGFVTTEQETTEELTTE